MNMKSMLAALSLLFLLTTGHVVFGQNHLAFTEADYDRAAAMLGGNVSKLIDNEIRPQWLADGRLWYRSLSENKVEYKLFNPVDGKMLSADSISELFEKADGQMTRQNRYGLMPE